MGEAEFGGRRCSQASRLQGATAEEIFFDLDLAISGSGTYRLEWMALDVDIERTELTPSRKGDARTA